MYNTDDSIKIIDYRNSLTSYVFYEHLSRVVNF